MDIHVELSMGHGRFDPGIEMYLTDSEYFWGIVISLIQRNTSTLKLNSFKVNVFIYFV